MRNGFSVIEALIAVAILGFMALTAAEININNQKSLRAFNGKSAAETMNLSIKQILADENSCAATVKAVRPSAPTNLSSAISLSPIILRKNVSGTWQNTVYYQVGTDYSTFKITEALLRDHISTDLTPGPKFEFTYELTGSIIGPKTFKRIVDAFVDYTASSSDSSYAFRCSTSPLTSSDPTLTETSMDIQCSGTRTLNCPSGKKVRSCGIGRDHTGIKYADEVVCWLNISTDSCSFLIDENNSCDGGITAHCYCN